MPAGSSSWDGMSGFVSSMTRGWLWLSCLRSPVFWITGINSLNATTVSYSNTSNGAGKRRSVSEAASRQGPKP